MPVESMPMSNDHQLLPGDHNFVMFVQEDMANLVDACQSQRDKLCPELHAQLFNNSSGLQALDPDGLGGPAGADVNGTLSGSEYVQDPQTWFPTLRNFTAGVANFDQLPPNDPALYCPPGPGVPQACPQGGRHTPLESTVWLVMRVKFHGTEYTPKWCDDHPIFRVQGPKEVIAHWEVERHVRDWTSYWNWYEDILINGHQAVLRLDAHDEAAARITIAPKARGRFCSRHSQGAQARIRWEAACESRGQESLYDSMAGLHHGRNTLIAGLVWRGFSDERPESWRRERLLGLARGGVWMGWRLQPGFSGGAGEMLGAITLWTAGYIVRMAWIRVNDSQSVSPVTGDSRPRLENVSAALLATDMGVNSVVMSDDDRGSSGVCNPLRSPLRGITHADWRPHVRGALSIVGPDVGHNMWVYAHKATWRLAEVQANNLCAREGIELAGCVALGEVATCDMRLTTGTVDTACISGAGGVWHDDAKGEYGVQICRTLYAHMRRRHDRGSEGVCS
ncbi:hypothetical protein F4604DRAFT_1690936 [Suillus subluteus]|nr:hypothetical protein F4604DRAFT_1690936 [Suillus subluteus]